MITFMHLTVIFREYPNVVISAAHLMQSFGPNHEAKSFRLKSLLTLQLLHLQEPLRNLVQVRTGTH